VGIGVLNAVVLVLGHCLQGIVQVTVKLHNIESLEGFQNDDLSKDWLSHDPSFEWDYEELEAFEQRRKEQEQKMIAMAAWWDMEGVRCATFGRDPNKNPYRA
jgi:hypothetical protein